MRFLSVFRFLPVFLLLSSFALAEESQQPSTSENKWNGPTFKLESLDGDKLSEADVFVDAELYLIDFWASWCRPCNQYLPHLVNFVDEFSDRGLKVVLFCVDDAGSISTARNTLKAGDYPFTILFDPESKVKDQLGVRRIPTTVLLDSNGKELWRHVGYEKGVEDEVAEKIDSLLPEED